MTVTATTSGTPHEIIEGLTSIIMPIYLHDYSLFHYTGHAIGSVREHTDEKKTPYEIVVVDNGSSITLPDPKMYKCDKYIKNEKNFGVTKAWNQGIRMSQGEYICILNNDVMVFDHWLEDLKEALNYVDLVMGSPMYGEPFSRAVEARQKREEYMNKMIGESFSEFKDFSCVLMKRSLLDELGLFDEAYMQYAQDSDFFKRMEVKGKKYASTKRVPIFHIIGATSMSMEDTPHQMDLDKQVFTKKWTKLAEQKAPDYGLEGIVGNQELQEQQEKAVLEEKRPKKPLIRTKETGDRVYLVKDEKSLHWITDPQVLTALGAGFDDVEEKTREVFSKYTLGETITLKNVQSYV